jgi:hypothetical protein
MSVERAGGTTFKGNPLTLQGAAVRVGQKAPEFKVLAGDLSAVTLESSKGKTRLFVAVPSLDTPVCDQETRKFNEAVAGLAGVQTYVISMDLPFAQGRFLPNRRDQEFTGGVRSPGRGFWSGLRRFDQRTSVAFPGDFCGERPGRCDLC